MIDWLDTSCCNEGVPVILCATPQFTTRMAQVERHTAWQSSQFRRRVKDYVRLPAVTSDADLECVARKLLPGADRATIKLALGYVKTAQQWPLSNLASLIEDARLIAADAGRDTVSFADVDRAIQEHRIPSDEAQRVALEQANRRQRGRRPAPMPTPEPSAVAPEEDPRETVPANRLQPATLSSLICTR
jgi:hypothetical protein